jgi:NarL family two-component system response regulator LiaR
VKQVHTLALVDDHVFMRRGLADYFAQTGRWIVRWEAADLEEAGALFAAPHAGTSLPDIVLLDITLKDSWGLDLIPRLKDLYNSKNPPVVVYSAHGDYAHIKAAFRSGAAGYVNKSQGEAELEKAMKIVLQGGRSFSPELLSKIGEISDIMLGLTKREREMFDLVQRGKSNRQIAEIMGIRLRTVENSLSIIYAKTGVHYREELENL